MVCTASYFLAKSGVIHDPYTTHYNYGALVANSMQPSEAVTRLSPAQRG
jgi:hypothetical protein